MINALLEFHFLWTCLWQTTLLLSLGLGLSFLCSRRPARAHCIMLLSLAACLITPTLSRVVHHFSWGVFQSRMHIVMPIEDALPPVTTVSSKNQEQVKTEVVLSDNTPHTPPQSQHREVLSPLRSTFSWESYFPSLWIVAVIVLMARSLKRLVKDYRVFKSSCLTENPFFLRTIKEIKERLNLKDSPLVRVSDQISCPAMWCWGRKPAFLVPSLRDPLAAPMDWRCVLTHEIAHWKRHDHLTHLIGEIVVSLFPWNPIGWLAKQRLSLMSEWACDDWVLAHGHEPEVYATSLSALTPQRRPAFFFSAVTSPSNLKARIRHILANEPSNPMLGRCWAMAATIMMTCFVAIIAFTQTRTIMAQGVVKKPLHVYGLGTLQSAIYCPNGRHIITAGGRGVLLWEITTGELIRELPSGMTYTASFSPKGSQLITAGDEGVAVWDVSSGEKIRIITDRSVKYMALSVGGTRVVTSNGEISASLRDAANGDLLRIFSGHTDNISSVAVSPDGQHILTGDIKGKAILWDASTGAQEHVFNHGDNIGVVLFFPDSTEVMTGGGDHAILWSAVTGKKLKNYTYPSDGWSGYEISGIVSASLSQDGLVFLTGFAEGGAVLWDKITGRVIQTYKHLNDTIKSIAFSPDRSRILTAGISWCAIGCPHNDLSVKIWDTLSGELIQTISGFNYGISSVEFSPNGLQILAGIYSNPRILWDMHTGEVAQTFEGRCHSFSPDGSQIVTQFNGNITLWDAVTGELIRIIGDGGSYSAISPDGSKILVAKDEGAKLWDITTGELIRVFTPLSFLTSPHEDRSGSVAISPDGSKILLGPWPPYGGNVELWDITGERIRIFNKGEGGPATFSSDCTKILTGSAEVWNAETGEKIQTFDGGTYSALSPDGTLVLTGSAEFSSQPLVAALWGVSTGKKIRVFSGHNKLIKTVTFSPDGKFALTGSLDGTAMLWDISDIVTSEIVTEE